MSESDIASTAHVWTARGTDLVLVSDDDGRAWLVYFDARGGRGQVVARDVRSGATVGVSEENIDCADLATSAGGGAVVAVWDQLVDGTYQLFAGDIAGSAQQQITDGPFAAVYPALAGDWLVYQSADERGDFTVRLCRRCAGRWSAPECVSDSPGNNWRPAVARTVDGGAAVAWDGYAAGSYDVYLRFIPPDAPMGRTMRLTGDGRFHAHVSLAPAADGAVWAAWNSGTPDWGKDNEVYRNTRIAERNYLHTRRLLEARRVFPDRVLPVWPPLQDHLDAVLPGLLHERPRLYAPPDGPLHVAFRFNEGELTGGHRSPKRWQAMVIAHDGEGWGGCVELAGAHGLSTGAISLLREGDNALLAAAAGEGGEGREKDLQTGCFLYELPARPRVSDIPDPPILERTFAVRRSAEKPARHTVRRQGEEYGLYFGDLHRHTELSFCRSCVDGSLEEAYRATRDAAAMDFAMTADHDHQEQAPDIWAETMKAADRFNVPGRFTTFFGYEWIGGRKNLRHRNVVSTVRVPPPPFDYVDEHRDVRKLWATLPSGQAITIPHHTACFMNLLWGRHPGEAADPQMEPLVEIFQASRCSSEYPGCPTVANCFHATGLGRDFCVEGGFVSDALRQGIRMGFIASSDHMSTHRSYACLYARENTRQGLMEAMLARRAYAASDRIVCEFAIGDAIMGGQTTAAGPLEARIRFVGTGPIREVTLLRDSEPWLTWAPSSAETEVAIILSAEQLRYHYFYARMIQQDTNMAWSSPIWVD